jgi:hypothetical protein
MRKTKSPALQQGFVKKIRQESLILQLPFQSETAVQ